MDAIGQLIDSVKRIVKKEISAYDTTATVRRVEGDTAWVHIPGGADETPVKLTINAGAGDDVQVRVSEGKAFLVGNGSSPPTDDARANQAYTVATVAEGAAENALANATRARDAADRAEGEAVRAGEAADTAEGHAQTALTNAGLAQTAAGNAQTSADSALVSLSTVEDVVGVLNWITAHGTMTNTQDLVPPETVIDPSHVYFVQDDVTPGDYHVGAHYYAIVSEPKQADIASYYLLSVDESVQNYVATHVAVDTEGLWLIPENNVSVANSSKKILISVGGVGHSYPTAGTYIIEKVNGTDQIVAMFTTAGVSYGDSTTASGTNSFALGQHTTASGQSSQAAGYYSTATAMLSHAEGYATHATSEGATAIGKETTASGDYSFSEGYSTTASGARSHAQGTGTTADQQNQFAIGKYNTTSNTNNLFVVGNGSKSGGNITREDAFQVDIYGNVEASGNVNIASGAKYKINGEAIGTVKQAYASAKSVSSATNTNLTSISLEAGTWVVTGGVRFPNNATGYRRMNISTSSASGWADVQLPALSGASTQLAYTVIVSPTSTKTYYLNCYHNAGVALNLMAGGSENGINFLRAVRIA